jgi:hypothetical protein
MIELVIAELCERNHPRSEDEYFPPPTVSADDVLEQLVEFGSGVFEFWWGIDGNNPPRGVWYFRMYQSAAFLVMHRPRLKAGLPHQK